MRVASYVVWGLLAASLLGCELAARRRRDRSATSAELWQGVMRHSVPRAIVILGWMWAGWHFFVR